MGGGGRRGQSFARLEMRPRPGEDDGPPFPGDDVNNGDGPEMGRRDEAGGGEVREMLSFSILRKTKKMRNLSHFLV